MEETTNIASSGQDVNTQPETTEVESQETQSTESKSQSEEQVRKNKEIAVTQERQKRKELEAKLAEYEKAEAERSEKLKMKKGKYEELINKKNTRISELEEKLNAAESVRGKYETFMTGQVNDLLGKIPDGKKDFVNEIIDWKDYESKVKILKGFGEQFKMGNPNPSGDIVKHDKQTAFDAAKEKKDIWNMIANMPTYDKSKQN